MYKKVVYTTLFVLLILFSACSAFRKNYRSEISNIDKADNIAVLSAIERNNISKKSFKISRFRAEIVTPSEAGRSVPGFLKYNKHDVLISLRSMAGLEIARGLIDKDSIRIYDRINKIIYLQSNKKFGQSHGLNKDLLGLIWGDLPASIIESTVREAEEYKYMALEEGRVYNYSIDKEMLKLTEIEAWETEKLIFRIKYSDYQVSDDCIYPSQVKLNLVDAGYIIDLSIKGISIEKTMNMNFKVDSKAERIILK